MYLIAVTPANVYVPAYLHPTNKTQNKEIALRLVYLETNFISNYLAEPLKWNLMRETARLISTLCRY